MEENDPNAETEKPRSASTKTSLNPSAAKSGVDETEKRHGPLDASGECRSTELQQQPPSTHTRALPGAPSEFTHKSQRAQTHWGVNQTNCRRACVTRAGNYRGAEWQNWKYDKGFNQLQFLTQRRQWRALTWRSSRRECEGHAHSKEPNELRLWSRWRHIRVSLSRTWKQKS